MKMGVALIVFSRSTERILTVEELCDKPSVNKKAGMYSFPLETIKDGETYENAVVRLIKEEIGVRIDEKVIFFCKPITIIPMTRTIAAYVVVEKEFHAQPQDNDVRYCGWKYISELMDHRAFVRQETRPILEIFNGIYLFVGCE